MLSQMIESMHGRILLGKHNTIIHVHQDLHVACSHTQVEIH